MKLGLVGSTETHRGTRWAPRWAFAAREAQAGEFEFSEIRRGTRRPIIFHHRALGGPSIITIPHISNGRLHQQVLELLAINIRPHSTSLKAIEVVLALLQLKIISKHTCKPFWPHASPSPP
ncbi:hypothetical protein E3N88_41402 [Mikania micrantha]|uniref:Uncharacterized protein n=1 Tax=Mikania micrantha TaxID=192012 RepID=A0A5N6LQH3_9ASTR|nr:hypothetical protein E3N88_41402 [Mikania micrantha]